MAASLICTTALTGCVGNTVNDSLESAALNSPMSLTETVEAPAIDYATLASVPVPVRSPVSSNPTGELALSETNSTRAADAANQLAGQPVEAPTIKQNAEPDLRTAALQPSEIGSGEVNASQELKTAATVDQPEAVQPNPTVKPAATAPKPQTLFGALFGARNGAQKTAKNPPAPAAKVQTARARASTNALPGVKRDSALFGIGEGENDSRKVLVPEDSVRVASVGSFGRFKTVNGLVLQTDRVKVDCFKPELMRILRIVERRYGRKVMVTSGFRSASANRRAGGARNSTHIYCKAADIQVDGVSKWDLAKFLRTVDGRGGVGTYCRTNSVHIDVGSVRDWHHPCRRSKSRAKKRRT